jgi:transcriptional regulator with XRE-family HTH domain
MPLTNESTCLPDAAGLVADDTINQSREAFCRRLRAARERRGLKLDDIADATKVCVSYYTALEANDLRRWPKGLFRRSFFRGYVSAVGLPVTETVDEFVRLFPEDERPKADVVAAPREAPCRLALDTSWHGPRPPIRSRMLTAAIDIAVVTVVSTLFALASPLDVALSVAVVVTAYFTLATIVLGGTPAAWGLRRRARSADAGGVDEGVKTPAVESSDTLGGLKRIWTSDARRVRPRHEPPGLRVRFKLSP